MNLSELGFLSYEEYLTSSYWKNIVEKLIDCNPNAECYICGNNYSLVLHHVNYESLGEEVFEKDIFILCWKHHKKAHWIFFFFKVPLEYKYLYNRLMFLKSIFCIQKRRFVRAIYYSLRLHIL